MTEYLYGFDGNVLYEQRTITTTTEQTRQRFFVYAFGRIVGYEEKLDGSAATKYWTITDHLGSVMAEADFQGTILDATGYADFGAPGLAPAARVNGHEMLQRYTGKDYDPATGLTFFNARWYSSELGRFITEDPIRDGVNWYAYCSNSPLSRIDPTGLSDDAKLFNEKQDPFTNNGKKSIDFFDGDLSDEDVDNVLQEQYQVYQDYFAEYGTGLSYVELCIWTALDTGNNQFFDAVPLDMQNSPLFRAAVDSALTIYYADDPGAMASEISKNLNDFMITAQILTVISSEGLTAALRSGTASSQSSRGALRITMESLNYQNQQLQSGSTPPLSVQQDAAGSGENANAQRISYPKIEIIENEYETIMGFDEEGVFRVTIRAVPNTDPTAIIAPSHRGAVYWRGQYPQEGLYLDPITHTWGPK